MEHGSIFRNLFTCHQSHIPPPPVSLGSQLPPYSFMLPWVASRLHDVCEEDSDSGLDLDMDLGGLNLCPHHLPEGHGSSCPHYTGHAFSGHLGCSKSLIHICSRCQVHPDMEDALPWKAYLSSSRAQQHTRHSVMQGVMEWGPRSL